MSEMLLLVEIAGCPAAIPAGQVASVIEVGHLVPTPAAPPHVAGLAVLRSRPLTAIDCRVTLGFAPTVQSSDTRAVVVEHEGHLYGLLVDIADDIVEALGAPVPQAAHPGAGWDRVAPRMIESTAGPLPLLDLAALIEGANPHMAA